MQVVEIHITDDTLIMKYNAPNTSSRMAMKEAMKVYKDLSHKVGTLFASIRVIPSGIF